MMGYGAVPTPLTRSHVRVSPAEPTEGRGWPSKGSVHADVRCEFLGPRGCRSRDPASIRPLHSSRAGKPSVCF